MQMNRMSVILIQLTFLLLRAVCSKAARKAQYVFKTDSTIFVTAVVPSSSTHYEDSSHGTVLHREHSEWDSEDKYPTNTSGEHLLPGIIHPTESEHEKESSHTGTSQGKKGCL